MDEVAVFAQDLGEVLGVALDEPVPVRGVDEAVKIGLIPVPSTGCGCRSGRCSAVVLGRENFFSLLHHRMQDAFEQASHCDDRREVCAVFSTYCGFVEPAPQQSDHSLVVYEARYVNGQLNRSDGRRFGGRRCHLDNRVLTVVVRHGEAVCVENPVDGIPYGGG